MAICKIWAILVHLVFVFFYGGTLTMMVGQQKYLIWGDKYSSQRGSFVHLF